MQELMLQKQELEYEENLQRKAEAQMKDVHKAQNAIAEQSLEAELMIDISNKLLGLPDPEFQAELQDYAESEIQSMLQQALNGQGISHLSPADIQALKNKLSKQLDSNIQQKLQTQMKEAFLHALKIHIQEKIAPEIEYKIENQLKTNLGQELAKAIEQSHRQNHKSLLKDRNRHDFNPYERFDDIRNALSQSVMPEIEATVKSEITQKVKESAVPEAIDILMESMDSQLAQSGLDDEAFKNALKNELQDILEDSLDGDVIDTELSTMRAKDKAAMRTIEQTEAFEDELNGILDLIKKTKQEITHQLENLEQSPEDLGLLSQEAIKDKLDEILDRSMQLLSAMKDESNPNDYKFKNTLTKIKRSKLLQHAQQAVQSLSMGMIQSTNDQNKELDGGLAALESDLKSAMDLLAGEASQLETNKALADQSTDSLDKFYADGTEHVIKDTLTNASKKIKASSQRIMKEAASAGKLSEREIKLLLNSIGALTAVKSKFEAGPALASQSGNGIVGTFLSSNLQNPYEQIKGNQRVPFDWKLYKEFAKDMQNRMNPNFKYEEAKAVSGIRSKAKAASTDVAAEIIIDQPILAKDAKNDEERSIPTNDFLSRAYGAAHYMKDDIQIDGDLGDWGKLEDPVIMKYRIDGSELSDGLKVYLRWSSKGLYVGYRIDDPSGKIEYNLKNSWDGDCTELFIDIANEKQEWMHTSPSAQKIDIMPFGWQGKPSITFAERGTGFRGLGKGSNLDVYGKVGKSGVVKTSRGYSVEYLIHKNALAHPMLIPGMTIGFNISVNSAYVRTGPDSQWQWSAPKAIKTWDKPDTWGDVLLLGSDAEILVQKEGEAVKGIIPNSPLEVEVYDPDMNLRDDLLDRIQASVYVHKDEPVTIILEETSQSSGRFTASFDTQPHFLPRKENTLNIQSGDIIFIKYTDIRAAYGESNREIVSKVPVGWPVLSIN